MSIRLPYLFKTRSFWMGFAILLYTAIFNWYLYLVANIEMESRISNLWKFYLIGGILICLLISERNQKEYFQRLFTDAGWCMIFITIIVILLTNHGYIKNPYFMLSIIDCGTLMATLMLLTSGGRHGLFKD